MRKPMIAVVILSAVALTCFCVSAGAQGEPQEERCQAGGFAAFKPLTLCFSRLLDEDGMNMVILSSAARPKIGKVEPQETQVWLLVPAKLDGVVPIKAIGEDAQYLPDDVFGKFCKNDPEFACAIVVHNTTEAVINVKSFKNRKDAFSEHSALGGCISLKSQEFGKHIDADFALVFKTGQVCGSFSLSDCKRPAKPPCIETSRPLRATAAAEAGPAG